MANKFFTLGLALAAALALTPDFSTAAEKGTGDALRGLRLYLGNCFICHGANARGDGPYADKLKPKPRSFDDAAYFERKTDQEIYNIISKGGPADRKSPMMHGWGFRLTRSQIQDLVAYVRSVSRNEDLAARPAPKHLSGQQMYEQFCLACHGPGGDGKGRLSYTLRTVKPAVLSSPSFQRHASDKDIFLAIKESKTVDGSSLAFMPAWKKLLSDGQIGAIVVYIRTFGQKKAQ